MAFTGAQGTGKTTILKEFESQGKNVITEVVRNLSKNGVKINKDGGDADQKKIFSTYKKQLSVKDDKGYISDRCLIDVFAYTLYLAQHNKVSKEIVNSQFKALKKFVSDNPDIIYCYFPIEFAVEDDGVRSLDEEYRKEIDNNIKSILSMLQIPFVIVKGTVRERVNIVNNVYKWLEIGEALFAKVV